MIIVGRHPINTQLYAFLDLPIQHNFLLLRSVTKFMKKEINVGGKTRWEDPYFTAAFKHGSSHGGCNVNGPKVAKFLDG